MVDDAPPIVTEPFDEFTDTAVRYRCPGLNERNTFTINGSKKLCRILATIGDPFIGIANTSKNCYVTIASDFLTNSRTCSTRLLVNSIFLVDRNITPHRYCYQNTNVDVNDFGYHAGCEPHFINLNSFNYGIRKCRKIQANPLSITFTRICRKPVFRIEPKPAITRERVCYNASYSNASFTYMCKRYPLRNFFDTALEINTNLNIISCKISNILGSQNIGNKICSIGKPTNLVPQIVTNYVLLCKKTTIREFSNNGRRACNIIKLNQNPLQGVVPYLPCHKTYETPIFVKLWKCGHIISADIEGATYGRVWGGRPATNFVIRVSGRMFGKIR